VSAPAGLATPSRLRRTLGFWLLFFYGVGIIVGAGIYVLVGTVAGKAGMSAPLSFALAGLLAMLTALAYAELVTRLPEASGSVAYVHAAARHGTVAWVVGMAVLFVAVTSGASIARGSAGYLQRYVEVPDWLPGAALVIAFTALGCLRVELGARLAALLGAIELLGLLMAIAAGADALGDLPQRAAELVPSSAPALGDLAAGAFLAFFAFIGFETLANMAEEARDVARTLPRAILAAIAAAAAFYFLVALVAVLAVPPALLGDTAAPLCLVIERAGLSCGRGFAAIALLALANGVIVEIMLVARLLYGMAHRRLVPAWFEAVDRRSRVPVRATLAGGAAMLLFVVLLPFEQLAGLTSGVTLAVFAAVNLSLVVLKLRDRRGGAAPPPVDLPLIVPTLGAVSSLGLLAAALV
jgi:amino acid transporter